MPIHRYQCALARDRRHFGGPGLWLLFRVLPAVLLGGLVVLLLSVSPAHAVPADPASRPGLDELESGQLLLQDGPGGDYQPAILQASRVHFEISGMIATVTLEQSFRNPGKRWLEGVYAFPLPDTAAVRYLEMVVGERRIVGRVREKAVAQQIYQKAKQSGRKASLVEQQRPNLFTNRVANIGPGETVTVKLEYVQTATMQGGEFSLRFPMTITPRYMPGQPLSVSQDETLSVAGSHGWASPTDQVPDAHRISPWLNPAPGSDDAPLNPVEISARLDMGLPLAAVRSPYHDIALERRAGVYDIRLVGGTSEMDRDFVLTWQPVTGSVPQAALFTEQVDGEYFGLLMVIPPAEERAGPATSREIVIVIDTSGSMGGVSIEQARASVSRALQQLRPADRFNIIEFNSGYHSLYRSPVPATPHHVQHAQEFVRHLHASGGTEMLPALRAALDPVHDPDVLVEQPAVRQVIFITDGAVGNETALFSEIASRLGNNRLFTVGIGSAPNSWFMRKAGEFGRGSHTHIGNINEVEAKMDALFRQLAHPAAIDLAVTWPVPAEAWPERLPDLYLGQPLVVAAGFGAVAPAGEVVVSGRMDGQTWNRRLSFAEAGDPERQPRHAGVATLWARKKITALLDQLVAGRDETEVREAVLPVALGHQLLSPYTSFVAVEEAVSRPSEAELGSEAVANTRPRGQSPQTFAFPQGATSAPLRLWLGGFLLFAALCALMLCREEVDRAPGAQAG